MACEVKHKLIENEPRRIVQRGIACSCIDLSPIFAAIRLFTLRAAGLVLSRDLLLVPLCGSSNFRARKLVTVILPVYEDLRSCAF